MKPAPWDATVAGATARRERSCRWLLLGLTALYFLAYFRWPHAVAAVPHAGQWFVDSYAILAANDAVAQGLNPYGYNPLDHFGRPHVYSHWWLRLGDLGLTRADNLWLALAWIGAFLAATLAWLRPRSLGEVAAYALILCSGPIVLAVDRANNDLVVFIVLAAVVPGLLAKQRAWRWLTVLWIALATGLKYYPAVAALVLLTGDDIREVRWRVGLMVAALLIVGLSLRHDLGQVAQAMPMPTGLYSFGARVIFTPLGWSEPAMKAAAGLVGAGFFALGWRAGWLAAWTAPSNDTEKREYLGFVLGAALLCGCFWSGMNYAYRWIFVLWLAPWLWRQLAAQQGSLGARRFARGLAVVLLLVLWSDTIMLAVLRSALAEHSYAVVEGWARATFLCVQPLVWLGFGGLLMVLAQFVRRAWERFGWAGSLSRGNSVT